MIREGVIEERRLREPSRGSRAGEEAGLVMRAREGDGSAIDQLYRQHRDRVFTLCLNLCGNREEAQDLLQETFLRAWQGLPRFAGRSALTTWLYRIAVNLARDAARQRRRCPLVPGAPASPGAADTGPDLALVDRVRSALCCLLPAHQAVLALRYSQSLSYEEIAQCLRWSPSRVKATLHRARRAFKKAYLRVEEA
jgi:RNA polymerase sigma-70 factor (ECF subfamily)